MYFEDSDHAQTQRAKPICKFTHVDLRNTNLLNANLSNISIDKCCYNCFTIWPNNISITNHDTYIQIKNYLQTLTNNLTNIIGEYSDLSNISLHNMNLNGIDLSNAIFSNTSCYNIIFPPKYLPNGYISSLLNVVSVSICERVGGHWCASAFVCV